MKNFIFDLPTRLLFGFGELNNLHKENLPGKKALIVITNGKSVKVNGYLARVEEQLDKAGIAHILFDEIKPNPTLKNVMDGAAKAKENGCDFVVALGGGSVMDAGKAIAFAMTNPGNLWDYSYSMTGKQKPQVAPCAPIVAITTTAGTGSEVDQWSVITKEETNEKSGFGTPSSYPTISIVDPDLMMTVPPRLTAYQGMDTFFHASESMINTKNTPMGEMFAIKAVELVAKYLPIAVKDGSNREARYYMALANTLAGFYMLCTSEHTMEHSLSGYYQDLPHGAGLIMLSIPYYKHFADKKASAEQMIKMAKVMGIENAASGHDFVKALQKLLDDCGVGDLKMKDFGVEESKLEEIALHTRNVLGGDMEADPILLSDNDLIKIFKEAYSR